MSTTNRNETLYTAYLEGSVVLKESGKWFHEGSPFTNKNVSDLFHRSIQWDDQEKRFYLVIGQGRAEFTVEDTAYFVVELSTTTSPWKVRLADSSWEELVPQTLCIGDKNQIYCAVKDGHRAKFSRSAFQTLSEYVVDDTHMLIDGNRISLSRLEDLSFLS